MCPLSSSKCLDRRYVLLRIPEGFSPPYSPEYNPDEYFNSDLKREMSKLPIPGSEEELGRNARSVLKKPS